jgi:hypothetical protein
MEHLRQRLLGIHLLALHGIPIISVDQYLMLIKFIGL